MPIKYYSKNQSFYPIFILSNIGLIISLNFIIRYINAIFINTVFGLYFHKEQVVGSSQYSSFDSGYTYAAFIISIIESFFMILAFVFIIEKANKILDYVCSNFILELFIISMYTGFPNNFSFWIFSLMRIIVITIISEFVSLKIEQQEISINSNMVSGTI